MAYKESTPAINAIIAHVDGLESSDKSDFILDLLELLTEEQQVSLLHSLDNGLALSLE